MPTHHNRTKIVATVGPATDTEKQIEALSRAGADVFRINAAHCSPQRITQLIRRIRKVDRKLQFGLGILVDLQGPKIRVGSFENAEPIWLETGQRLIISCEPGVIGRKAKPGEVTRIGSKYDGLHRDVKVREKVLLDDGNIELRVTAVKGTDIHTKVVYGGLLLQHKGINLPGTKVSSESLTSDDVEDLRAAVAAGADFIALSFVRTAADIDRLRRWLRKLGSDAGLIAKIEGPTAVRNLKSILNTADGLMVARGDLGVEVGAEVVPALQKKIIAMSVAARKPVITATQMLESMVTNPRPTRAEASDVANAIYDGSSAVMLSGETASGKNPIRTVKIMDKIIRESEKHSVGLGQGSRLRRQTRGGLTVTQATVRAAVYAAFETDAKLIAVFSESGATARAIAAERPGTRVIAFTPFQRTVQRLSLVWGVRAFRVKSTRTSQGMTKVGERLLLDRKIARKGDSIVVVFGTSRQEGLTNIMNIRTL